MTTANLVLGTMYFGTRLDDRASFALLDHFVAAGGRWIDTANAYAFWEDPSGQGGQSEAVIGRWLAANPGVRDRVLISTKVGGEPEFPGGFPDHIEGLSAQVVRTGLAASLDRLGVDSVDLYWAHVEDRSTPLAETIEAMTDAVAEGTVSRLGWSNHPTWRVERAQARCRDLGRPGISALQHRYSYLQPRPGSPVEGEDHRFGMLSDEMIDYAASNELELWAYTSLLLGAYDRDDRDFTPAYDHVGNERRLVALRQVAGDVGATPGQVVLAWLAGSRPIITPILGGSRIEQLDAALAGVRLELGPEHRALLDAAH